MRCSANRMDTGIPIGETRSPFVSRFSPSTRCLLVRHGEQRVALRTVTVASHEALLKVAGRLDGYRLRLERDGDRVRLITRGGFDWAKRYPWIAEMGRKIRQQHFVIDGEAVVLGVDGRSDFRRAAFAQARRRSATLRFRHAGR
jgi:ATP dependent DNA ligase-like protein